MKSLLFYKKHAIVICFDVAFIRFCIDSKSISARVVTLSKRNRKLQFFVYVAVVWSQIKMHNNLKIDINDRCYLLYKITPL